VLSVHTSRAGGHGWRCAWKQLEQHTNLAAGYHNLEYNNYEMYGAAIGIRSNCMKHEASIWRYQLSLDKAQHLSSWLEVSAMSSKRVPSKVRRAYKFIESHRNEFSVQMMCRLLGVARAGYYAWLDHPVSDRAQEDARLLRLIRATFAAGYGIYGAPRVFLDLRERGETCSMHRFARLVRENGLRALHGYRTRHIPVAKPQALLQRQVTVSRPNVARVTDHLHPNLAGLALSGRSVDLFSRKVVGWAVKPTIHRELVLDAVMKAVRCRRPRKAMIHSDQGAQYGSDAWRRFCRANRLESSMSRRANCWDNAVAESFFSSLKKERIKKRIYIDREAAAMDISEYVQGFYHSTCRHSYLGGVSPIEFEAARRGRRSRVH
jgi:putative transposase